MSVDMYEHRFREELNKLDPFVPNDQRDQRVWRADFPAWRALFTSCCLWGHSTGYRLFSFDDFFRTVRRAYCELNPRADQFKRFFQGDLLPGMKQRVSAWYESGMAETYLYVCLVEAIEDKISSVHDQQAVTAAQLDVLLPSILDKAFKGEL